MTLFTVFDIAGSGLSASSVRLNTTASNLANAHSVSSSQGGTYRARHPVFRAVMDDTMTFDGSAVGVQVLGIVASQAPLRVEHRPDHAMADDKGNIYRPNVNMVEELANMISASRTYQTNVEVMNASKMLAMRTLSLGD